MRVLRGKEGETSNSILNTVGTKSSESAGRKRNSVFDAAMQAEMQHCLNHLGDLRKTMKCLSG
jgi:hypothetical protein